MIVKSCTRPYGIVKDGAEAEVAHFSGSFPRAFSNAATIFIEDWKENVCVLSRPRFGHTEVTEGFSWAGPRWQGEGRMNVHI
jgi:hypothetical protein